MLYHLKKTTLRFFGFSNKLSINFFLKKQYNEILTFFFSIGYSNINKFDAILIYVNDLEDNFYFDVLPKKRNPNSRYVAYVDSPRIPESWDLYGDSENFWFNWTMSRYQKSDLKTSPGHFSSRKVSFNLANRSNSRILFRFVCFELIYIIIYETI